MKDIVLRAKNIFKSFGNVDVLKGVDFEVKAGTVHALVGENGAGKSTLIKIITGIYTKDKGDIYINGKNNNSENMNDKIAFVPQELTLFPHLTVAENIFIDDQPLKRSKALIDYETMNRMANDILKDLNVNIDPCTALSSLNIASQQMVQIARAIAKTFDILILDEPTAAITVVETKKLFKIIENLKSKNKSIIFITHKLDEVEEICDEITILRDGNSMGKWAVSDISRDEIVSQMAGGKLVHYKASRENTDTDEIIMEINSICGYGFYDVSFKVKKGEILGIAGLVGSGRTETAEAIYGLSPILKGQVIIGGDSVKNRTPIEGVKNGIVYFTEERKTRGIFPNLSIRENIMVPIIGKYKKGPLVSNRKLDDVTKSLVKEYNVKTPSIREKISHLSGGNQQKALLARSIAMKPKIIILDEPTRGIDVNARVEIYDQIDRLVNKGIGVIVISSDMEELQKISDRILIFHNGSINAEIKTSEANNENMLRYAMGLKE